MGVRRLADNAGDLNAFFEIFSEIERQDYENGSALPHLAIIPQGWVAMLRHPDCGAHDDQAQVRILICPHQPDDAAPAAGRAGAEA